jgi:hypothetical protein
VFWRNAGEGSLEGACSAGGCARRRRWGGPGNAALINSLPAMNLAVDDFRIGDKALGQLDLRARNDQGAWRLETLHLQNPDGVLNGKAVWRNDVLAAIRPASISS